MAEHTPAIGVCEFCSQQFTVPLTELKKVSDSQINLQKQFDQHKCKREDSSQNALRIVREATENK